MSESIVYQPIGGSEETLNEVLTGAEFGKTKDRIAEALKEATRCRV